MCGTVSVPGEGEVLDFRRISAFGGAEFLRARFGDFEFARHAHDRVTFGLIEEGALKVEQPGGSRIAGAGDLILFNHDKVHWGGAPRGVGWSIRSIYIEPGALQELARELGDAGKGTLGFPGILPEAGRLARRFCAMHACFEAGAAPLEAETRFASVVADLLRDHSDRPIRAAPPGGEPRAVGLARAYLEAHVPDHVTLRELARVAGLSSYRLARAFTASLGMPPHAYHLHLRVRRAQLLLRAGAPVAAVALDCGFADQSHLTRAFKRQIGLTPGRFRAA